MISVITPAFVMKEELVEITRKCLTVLRNTPDCELINIDNGSSFGSDMMKDLSDIYIRNKENLGFTKALNQGLKLASGDYLVVGNNDYVVEDDWQIPMMDILNKDPNVGTISPSTYAEPVETKFYWCCGQAGAFNMMTRKTFEILGLYDEQFMNTFSDTDYAIRMFEKGLKPYQTRLCRSYHKGQSTLSNMPRTEYFESRDKYLKKWEHKIELRDGCWQLK